MAYCLLKRNWRVYTRMMVNKTNQLQSGDGDGEGALLIGSGAPVHK